MVAIREWSVKQVLWSCIRYLAKVHKKFHFRSQAFQAEIPEIVSGQPTGTRIFAVLSKAFIMAKSSINGFICNPDRCWRLALAIGWLVPISAMIAPAPGCQISGNHHPLIWQQDAELTDIFFIDPHRGWAVGAEGVILRTTSGGREWLEVGNAAVETAEELSLKQKLNAMQRGIQTSSTGIADLKPKSNEAVRVRWETVFFIDENRGWVAGGFEIPYTGHSRGVVMKTLDGGVSWRLVEGVFAPRINKIAFTDSRNGWAVGQRGGLLGEGIFFTGDGGETWSGSPTPYSIPDVILGWRSAIALADGFIGLSTHGRAVQLKRQQAEIAIVQSQHDQAFAHLAMQDHKNGWAVGTGGAVFRTADAGLSWRPAFELESMVDLKKLLTQFDFRTVCCTPSHLWFAGNPGSLIFSIERATGSIRTHATGSPLPINKIQFADVNHGWAVGPLGLILATHDGGDSWQLQRNPHRSLAVMGVAVSASDLPLEVTAVLANEQDYLVGTVLLDDDCSAAVREAFQNVGGSLVESIAIDHAASDYADAETAYLAAIVKQIRIFRPHLIIANSEFQILSASTDDQGWDFQFDPESFLRMAIKAAADRNQFPDQIRLAGLEPWSVDRMAYRSPQGGTEYNQSTLLFGAGKTMEDFIAFSRGLLGLPLFGTSHFAYQVDTLIGPRQPKPHEILSGLQQGIRPLAKRKPTDSIRGNRGALDNANRKRQMISTMEKFEIQQDQDWGIWAQEVTRWLSPLDHDTAGLALIKLAENYHQQGKFELASRSLEVLLNRFPDHPLEAAAMLWLGQFYASQEYSVVSLNRQTIHQRAQRIADREGMGDQNVSATPQAASQPVVTHQDGQTIITWTPTVESLKEIQPRRLNTLPHDDRDREKNAANQSSPNQDSKTSPVELAGYTAGQQISVGDRDASGVSGLPASSMPSAESEVLDSDEPRIDMKAWGISRSKLANQIYSRLGSKQPDLINRVEWRWLSLHAIRRSFGFHAAETGIKRLSQTYRDMTRDKMRSSISNPRPDALENAGTATIDTRREKIQSALLTETFGQVATSEIAIQQNDLTNIDQLSVQCRLAEHRPTLDGKFDDPVWIRQWQPGVENSVTQFSDGWFMMAYDAEFVYLAINCQKLPHQFYRTDLGPRTRNPNLSSRDRVEFAFDTDRDYATSFQFSVDHRGWGAENLCGAEGWNPTWYIAQAEDDRSWSVEIAIPLEELIDGAILPGDTWAISINRYDRDGQPRWQNSSQPRSQTESTMKDRRGNAASGFQGFFHNLTPQPESFRLLQFD